LEFDDIERILELVKQHELAEFELERDGLKLRIRKTGPSAPPPALQAQLPTITSHPVPPPIPVLPPASLAETVEEELPVELVVVKSPIVGTFYRCPEPGAASFVEVGERVQKDQVLCIIEAMKLMNEITSEYEGEIVNAYVENGKPVQYGERLFAIKTS
jgi:acetyl-CoA carboxylase biotin carboxyl carrier protein